MKFEALWYRKERNLINPLNKMHSPWWSEIFVSVMCAPILKLIYSCDDKIPYLFLLNCYLNKVNLFYTGPGYWLKFAISYQWRKPASLTLDVPTANIDDRVLQSFLKNVKIEIKKVHIFIHQCHNFEIHVHVSLV